jgi:hypothetical protein
VALKRAIGKLYFGVEEVSHFEEDLKMLPEPPLGRSERVENPRLYMSKKFSLGLSALVLVFMASTS